MSPPATIVNYDKILVLDDGSIAEFDEPTTLFAQPESRFLRGLRPDKVPSPGFVVWGAAAKDRAMGWFQKISLTFRIILIKSDPVSISP
ncbi:hypothetical protein C8R46DRAFT_1234433 [Mycena filopes]|nr:hypothetical protein C8R46DRAFT_1234433 [Mycena filopes]